MPTLDPNPKNELGKGILPPHVEADFLARGYVFACRVQTKLPFGAHVVCKRPIADAVTDGELDNPLRAPRHAILA